MASRHWFISRVLLETGPSVPNVNLTNGDKETALHCAAQYGHLECVKQLLDAGAEPNIKNIREETALDHAAQYGRQVTQNSSRCENGAKGFICDDVLLEYGELPYVLPLFSFVVLFGSRLGMS